MATESAGGPWPTLDITAAQSLESLWDLTKRKREAKKQALRDMAGRDAERALMIVLQSWLSTGVPRLGDGMPSDGTARELVRLSRAENLPEAFVTVGYENSLRPGLYLWELSGHPDSFVIRMTGGTGRDRVAAELRRAGFDVHVDITDVVVRNLVETPTSRQEEVQREVLAGLHGPRTATATADAAEGVVG